MISRLLGGAIVALALMLAPAVAGDHTMVAPGERPDGILNPNPPPAEDALTYARHWLADNVPVLAWMHPAVPVPTHNQHLVWRGYADEVIAAAEPFRSDAQVAELLGRAQGWREVVQQDPEYQDPTKPQHANVHRYHEAAAALMARLAHVGRTDATISRLKAGLDAALWTVDTALCGNELPPPDANAATDGEGERMSAKMQTAGAGIAAILLVVVGGLAFRRRIRYG